MPEEYQDFLRFPWCKNYDVNRQTSDDQMCVNLFGGTSSSSCYNFVLKLILLENGKQFGTEVGQTLQTNCYGYDMYK